MRRTLSYRRKVTSVDSAPTPTWPRPWAGDWWWDLVPALPLLLVGLVGTGQAAENQQDLMRAPDVTAYLLVAVAASALLLRRRVPVLGLGVCGVTVSTYLALGYPFGPILLTGPAAVYAIATRVPWRRAVAGVALFLVVTSAAAAPHFFSGGAAEWVGYLVWVGTHAAVVIAPGALAAAVQVRRRSEAGIRIEQGRRAVSEERLAMARDVHDGVGHGLAVIALHAGVALHVLDREPERVRDLLTSIQATSRESLDGLRAELQRIRPEQEHGVSSVTPRAATPGLAELPVLLSRMRDGGLVVHHEPGPSVPLPPDLDTTAYRIIQESLTNVLRHAGPTPAWVGVDVSDAGTLVIQVRDHGRPPAGPRPPDGAGTGLTGMRLRASAVGGRVEAGPAPEGGFLVRAELPLTLPVKG